MQVFILHFDLFYSHPILISSVVILKQPTITVKIRSLEVAGWTQNEFGAPLKPRSQLSLFIRFSGSLGDPTCKSILTWLEPVLTEICKKTNDVKYLSMCFLTICTLPWRSIYSSPLPLFSRVTCLFVVAL